MLPTTNILLRTFHIKYRNQIATCFTIDEAGRQYVVTASHVVKAFPKLGAIEVFHEGLWKMLECALVGAAPGGVDITVLAPSVQISPSHPLPPSCSEISLGQDVFFLGFPYGLTTPAPGLTEGFPLPLVKKACLSSMFGALRDGQVLLLDGINNSGFSGGPVVYYPIRDPRNLKVAAVISGYRFEEMDIEHRGQKTGLTSKHNTGIIIAYSIAHAVELIKQNPIGILITV